MAETSLDYDRETKGPLYARAGAPQYWLVDVAARCVEVRRNPGAGGYQMVERLGTSDVLTVDAFPDVILPVGALFPERR